MTATDQPLAMRKRVQTPCCERTPLAIGAHRYVCRGCGTIYTDAARMIVDAFGGAATITDSNASMYPSTATTE